MTSDIHAIFAERFVPLEPLETGVAPRLDRISGIRAVLFDIYGTLIISGVGDVGTTADDSRRDAFAQALAAAGFAWTSDGDGPADAADAYTAAIRADHKRSRQNGIEHPEVDVVDVWRVVVNELLRTKRISGPPPDHDSLRRLAVEYESRINPVAPMPHLRECLNALRDAGRRIGVVSNAQFFTPALFPILLSEDLELLGVEPDLCFFSFEHGRAKPGVFLFERALESLAAHGVTAGETLYVGNDMLNDVYAAARVGIRTALFAGDRRSLRLREDDPRVTGVRPDLVITDLAQLPDCLPG